MFAAGRPTITRWIIPAGYLLQLVLSSEPLQLPQCPLQGTTADTEASSVHQLRLSDIRVLAAMGDSITAGYLSRSSRLRQQREYKDASFSAGTASDVFTVAGMLRQFSDRLAVHSSRLHSLNVAMSGMETDDLMRQAREMIASVRDRHDIDANKDWKMVTILMGNNDICRNCKQRMSSAAQADVMVKRIRKALDLLQEELPRTLVNLLPIFNFRVSFKVERKLTCRIYYAFTCPCVSFLSSQSDLVRRQRDFNSRLEALVASGRYDQDPQFTVVLQPFTGNLQAPTDPDTGYVQGDLVAPDCFHPSLLGQQLMAKMLWNNILTPEGSKSRNGSDVNDGIKCPSDEVPYIPTRKN